MTGISSPGRESIAKAGIPGFRIPGEPGKLAVAVHGRGLPDVLVPLLGIVCHIREAVERLAVTLPRVHRYAIQAGPGLRPELDRGN
jgi:hypothetical protein|nr:MULTISPECIES: hypothetical protein [Methanoculleus]